MEQNSHQCGYKGVYLFGCVRCIAIDLANSPDVRVRAYLQTYRTECGEPAMRALIAAIQEARQS